MMKLSGYGYWMMINRRSLVSWCIAAVTLQAPRVVDIIATRTTPIIRIRNITLTTRRFILFRTMLRLRVVTTLASISELKVQKIAFQTIPFPIFLLLSLTRMLPPSLPGLRSRSLSLLLLLLTLYLHKMHRRLQKT